MTDEWAAEVPHVAEADRLEAHDEIVEDRVADEDSEEHQ